jgi:hypothetical protein
MKYKELPTDEFRVLLAKSDIFEDRHGIVEEFEQAKNRLPKDDTEIIQYLIGRYYGGSRDHLMAIVAARPEDEVMPELLVCNF